MCCRTLARVLVLLLASLIIACGVGADSSLQSVTGTARGAVIGAETAIDPLVYPIAQPFDDTHAKVAFDGTNYFVVWWGEGSNGLFGARVSQSGMLLDPVAIRIGSGHAPSPAIDVAFNGAVYLVTWSYEGQYVLCARVSPNGVVLDQQLLDGTGGSDPAVASDGSNFMVVWSHNSAGVQGIYAARVGGGGEVLDPGGVYLGPESANGADPEIAFDGTTWLVVFTRGLQDAVDVYGLRVSADATAAGAAFPISGALTGDEREPDVDFAPALDSSLVVWQAGGVVYGRRVRSDGLALGSGEVRISVAANASWPQVRFGSSPTGWIVTWSGNPYVYAARVDAVGVVGTTQIRVSSGNGEMPAVASSGSDYLVAWHERIGTQDIFARRVSLQGSVLDSQPQLISRTSNRQWHPAVASDGTNSLVVWVDDRNGGDIRAARVNKAGVALDEPSLVVTSSPEIEDEPDVAFNGVDYLVAWTRSPGPSAEIFASRISVAGAVKDPAGIRIAAAREQGEPTVAALGTDFLVAWSGAGVDSLDILGKRVAADGMLRDADPIGIGVGPNRQAQPAATSDGMEFFVVWQDTAQHSDIYGARVAPTGVVLDPSGIRVTSTQLSEKQPDVAFDGTQFFVAWAQSTTSRLYGTRVSKEGKVRDPLLVLDGEESSSPAVAYDGYTFLVLWQYRFHGDPADIFGRRVNAAGEAGLEFEITRDAVVDSMVALAPSGPGKVAIAYGKTLDSTTLRGGRVFFKTFEGGPAGAACSGDAECLTGSCAGGFCCIGFCSGDCPGCAPGTGECTGDDALCYGSCSRCTAVAGGFQCTGDESLCRGDCAVCQRMGSIFNCVTACLDSGSDGPRDSSTADDSGDSPGADAAVDAAMDQTTPEDAGAEEAAQDSAAETAVLDGAAEVWTGGNGGILDAAGESGADGEVSNARSAAAEEGCACRATGEFSRFRGWMTMAVGALALRRRRRSKLGKGKGKGQG